MTDAVPPQDPAQVVRALEIARQLVAAGVPVFTAPPRTGQPGKWHLPDAWQAWQPNPGNVDRWRPGWALAAVCGHLVDVLDVDPRHQGDATVAMLQAGGAWPTTYGLAATPSGGQHHLIAPLRVAKANPIPGAPGVDLQSGQPDGGGRAFVFIAPTVGLSKVDGQWHPYQWLQEPDLDKLAESAADDTSGAAIIDMVTAKRSAARAPRPATPTAAAAAAPSDTVRARVDQLAAELAATPEGSGNNEATRIGYLVGQYVGAGQLTLDTAERQLAAALAGWQWRDQASRDGVYMSLRRALEDGAGQPRPWTEPVPQDQAQLLREILGYDPPPPPAPTAEPTIDISTASTPARFFKDSALLVETLANAILTKYPCALTQEHKVAIYMNGVYRFDALALSAATGQLLGDRFSPKHRASVAEFIAGHLYTVGRVLPERSDGPVINLRNGMLDLTTGELKPHNPDYLSAIQLPIEWDSKATCPHYEEWINQVIPDQVDDIEETISTMLDTSRTPTSALFCFGPSRSGKSTFLRLAAAIAGAANVSAVTLHQLVDNRFAAANVYGKILNSAADISSVHVEDIGIFKMMTGEDPIHADRKYGGQFTFTNRALFAFSANTLPTVGESSRAYVERIKPFAFFSSFAGREKPEIEVAMMKELPGILARWARAYLRLTARGRRLETAELVRSEFEERSDRVRQWVADCCELTGITATGTATPGALLPPVDVSSRRWLARQFNAWAREQGSAPMGERKIIDRLTSMNGVVEVRSSFDKSRGLNIRVKDDRTDSDLLSGRSGSFSQP